MLQDFNWSSTSGGSVGASGFGGVSFIWGASVPALGKTTPSPSTSVSKLVGTFIEPAPNSALNSSITVPASSTHVSRMNFTRSFIADL